MFDSHIQYKENKSNVCQNDFQIKHRLPSKASRIKELDLVFNNCYPRKRILRCCYKIDDPAINHCILLNMTAIDFCMKTFFSGGTRLIGACPWGCSPIKQCDLIFRWIKKFSKQALISSLLSAYHSCPGTFSRQREPAIVGKMRLLTRLCGESVECLGTSWARTKI